jgi:dTDP-4-amino-4,6-dideoxygalactose transaminase
MKVTFFSLEKHDAPISSRIVDKLLKSVDAGQFVDGIEIKSFEEEFANTIKAQHCIATGNGTDSLFAILKSLGLKSGDEVITPALSWISSAETISLCGATPIFADIDPQYYTIDPSDVASKITEKTKAIIAVHLYGQACDIDTLLKLCRQHNLFLIEDCAQAHLTSYAGKMVGSFGKANAFSFYPTKNLGAYGDAGCVTTNDEALAERIRRFCNHGALRRHDHEMEGMNSRMDTLQAAVLNAKLPYLAKWNNTRMKHALRYKELLSDVEEVILPEVRAKTIHTFHIFAIRCVERDRLQQYLLQEGIQTLVHYPRALTDLPIYQNASAAKCPIATSVTNHILSLPVYPELSDADLEYVAEKIKAFYRK